MKINLLYLLACLFALNIHAQIGTEIPSSRIVDWTKAGYQGTIPEDGDYAVIINITDAPYNADNTGVDDVTTKVQNAIDMADPTVLTMIFFPPGDYKFLGNIKFTHGNIVLKGSGHYHTRFNFMADSYSNIQAEGNEGTFSAIDVIEGYTKGSNEVVLDIPYPGGFSNGDYVLFEQGNYSFSEWNPDGCNQAWLDNASWSSDHRIGEIMHVQSVLSNVDGNTILVFDEELSFDYDITRGVWTKKFEPIENIGVENVKINELNSNGGHNIFWNFVANSWVKGVESNYASYYHLYFRHSTHIEVSGCYIHNTYNYSVGYGICFAYYFTSFCLAENNIIDDTRHAITISSGGTNNVVGYNYAINSRLADKYDNTMPGGVTSDIFLHGYYPSSNLFEGNVTDKLHSDEYHGNQGLYNTFFRNKFTSPSIFGVWGTDFANAFGNKNVVGYSLSGGCPSYVSENFLSNCNYPYYDCGTYSDLSYYKTSKPDFLLDFSWPTIGTPVTVDQTISNTIPAQRRYISGGQECVYERSELVGYSVDNDGLFSAFNQDNTISGVLVKNEDRYSVGYKTIHSETTLEQVIRAVTRARIKIGPVLREEMLVVINNASGGHVYRTNYENGPLVLVHSEPGATITAITAGNFDADPEDEIVFAYLDNANRPFVWRGEDLSNLKTSLLYSGAFAYWRIDALTTGNFDNDGDDELILGFNSTGSSSAIYHSSEGVGIGVKIWEDLSNYWDVAALAAGDFNGDGEDELIQGFNAAPGPAIYKVMDGLFDSPTNIYLSTSGYWQLGALAAGDFDLDNDDELVIGFNSDSEGPNIYKSELGDNEPWVRIYDKNQVYWRINALAIEKCYGLKKDGNCYSRRQLKEERNRSSEDSHGNDSNEMMNIYPNPSTGLVNIDFGGQTEQDYSLQIYNQVGDLVHQEESNKKSVRIDLSDLPDGVYIVKCIRGNQTYVQRFVKQ